MALDAPAKPDTRPAPARQPSKKKQRKKQSRILSGRTLALAGASTVMAGAAFLILTKSSPDGVTQTHVLTTPENLGCYMKQPQLATQLQAKALQQEIVKESSGAAKHVIYGVYENSTCGGATVSDPQVFLFIGGNLSGTSPSSFISGFTGQLPGTMSTRPGPLGGDAACIPSIEGRPAECAWADNDTFGAVASASLSESQLANEMRQTRALVEKPARPGRHSRSAPSAAPTAPPTAAKPQPGSSASTAPRGHSTVAP